MGTHGRTGLRKFLLGSVAEDVAQQARQPILLVRNPDTLTPPTSDTCPHQGSANGRLYILNWFLKGDA